MAASLLGPSDLGPAGRFAEASASLMVVRVDAEGTIVAANAQTLALTGRPLIGEPWNAMLLNFAGVQPFREWLADPGRPRLLSVRTEAGLPQTFRVTVFEDASGYLLFGEVDAAEQARLGREVMELNRELSDLSRDLAQANADLAHSVREKEALLKETHHRVKNNLALITSLMRIEARRASVPETRSILKEMEGRVHSVVLLNETLYKTANYDRVNLSDYLRQIATHVFRAHAPRIGDVNLVLELDLVDLESSQAIPCGLIANELIMNSLKHGFPHGRSGEVRLSLRQDAKGEVSLSVSDTGIGLPDGYVVGQSGSLGLSLAEDLARQLGGQLEVSSGPTFSVTFAPRGPDADLNQAPPSPPR